MNMSNLKSSEFYKEKLTQLQNEIEEAEFNYQQALAKETEQHKIEAECGLDYDNEDIPYGTATVKVYFNGVLINEFTAEES